jgi:hypothetical protein
MTNQSKIKSFKRLGYLIGTISCGILSYNTLTGDLQNHIHFAGTLNEIGFFMMGSLLTIIFAIMTCSE